MRRQMVSTMYNNLQIDTALDSKHLYLTCCIFEVTRPETIQCVFFPFLFSSVISLFFVGVRTLPGYSFEDFFILIERSKQEIILRLLQPKLILL